MKEEVLEELKKRCKDIDFCEDEKFTAKSIADTLGIGRNTVSQYLNEYVKQKEVVKINSRPVYFLDQKEVEACNVKRCEQNVFSSFDEYNEYFSDQRVGFGKLIGSNNSLSNVVNHCKAAVSYPGHGLPILIHGPTGTGKSMIASLCFEYAKNHKIVNKDSRFVSVNCSEYANNPELLTANLFGHVKGAYTGAEEDNPGLMSLADGGILFLDEVHCLKAECQEKLFFFMDKGMFHKVGDNENWYTSTCRLIFATTEDPQNALLKTLLRRIPIMVQVPPLKERPLTEKKELIYTILKKEAMRLGTSINISNMVYQTLMDFEFVGNVGAMKNAIKATCANAFLTHKGEGNKLNINIYDLPDYIFTPLTTVQIKVSEDSADTMIPLEKLAGAVSLNNPLLHLYEQIITRFQTYKISNESFQTFIKDLQDLIQHYLDYIAYKNRYRPNANDSYLLKVLDKIYSIMMNKFSLNVPNSEIQVYSKMLSDYTKYVVDAKVWMSDRKQVVDEMMQELYENAPRSYTVAQEVGDNAKLNLDIEIDDVMAAIITVSFIGYEKTPTNSSVGVIFCHGYSTASSIAETANRMLGQYIFDGIDMQIDLSIEKVAMLADDYLKRKEPIDELILLVDMGSLEEIYKRIRPIANCNITLMNNVSTRMALEVGSKIMQGISAKEILDSIKNNYELSTHYIGSKAKKNAIVSICATGFGAAQKISELLLSSLPCKIPVEIIPYEYQPLVENTDNDALFNKYNVQLLIGTIDPNVRGYDFVPVENLMMNDGIEKLEQIICEFMSEQEFAQFKTNIMKNFTLSNIVNHLTILNAEKVIEDVEEIVEELENNLEIRLDTTRKTGLYIHLSCLIERMMLRNEIKNVEGIEEMLEKNKKFVSITKDAFSGVEMRYSVEIPNAEILYVLNYFKNA